jgi:VWFA-related protein
MRILLGIAIAAALLAQAPNQKAPQKAPEEELPAAISVDVDVVGVLTSVRDKRGGLVANLEKSDFTVLEDGKPQTIKYFSRETDLPLTIGLLVDVSGSQINLIEVERRAASQFFTQVLRKKDLAFLISFGSEAELLQDSTGSPRLLEEGLRQLRPGSGVGGLHPGPVPTIGQPRGTVLFDAVYLAAAEKLKREAGRKVIVIITDGVDTGSRVSINTAIEAAQKADAVIYSIEYYDPGAYGGGGIMLGGGGGGGTLRKISEETGGRVYKVDRRHSLDQIFKELQDEMRSQYMIGYTPANSVKDGSFRKIEIKMSNKDLKPQARKGYYAVKPER